MYILLTIAIKIDAAVKMIKLENSYEYGNNPLISGLNSCHNFCL